MAKQECTSLRDLHLKYSYNRDGTVASFNYMNDRESMDFVKATNAIYTFIGIVNEAAAKADEDSIIHGFRLKMENIKQENNLKTKKVPKIVLIIRKTSLQSHSLFEMYAM